jgi:excisionase family DNA binding protein
MISRGFKARCVPHPKESIAMKEIVGIEPAPSAGLAAEPELDRKARFAQRASVSVRCVDNWIHDRRIPFLKIGRTVLIPWREALETLNRNYRLNPHRESEGRS